MVILVFWFKRARKFLLELEETLLIMRDELSLNYVDNIVSIPQVIVTRSLVEFYLFLIIAILFLLNGLFIILL